MRKNIDLSEDAVIAITIEAVRNKTDFKNHVQNLLEDYAKPLIAFQKRKCGGKKLKTQQIDDEKSMT